MAAAREPDRAGDGAEEHLRAGDRKMLAEGERARTDPRHHASPIPKALRMVSAASVGVVAPLASARSSSRALVFTLGSLLSAVIILSSTIAHIQRTSCARRF